ncbi:hypothetical protein A2634_01730 [Candidatus Amesbacteria bacterium RIFCSPHIGHO2_01_FULL_48_32]|uniref:Uncharacterized protein n=1 Tax=Candidatus Amesbacteria bacterium RIFCSPLOWO2_01_FULL_48_25 TaxID=1797259 RepID=A0A1F4ZAG8_9BACT|nr:MAG: hypothetical protein A2634_01730 [Candidatus Amesbacteria bacterium RIFCSPHIGHO2_01_FULL_48_32]OGD03380.1 MAG: hypothetical protein A2989_00930 [Candidatus Amesbacteria bacterium RIFCSPLOWO2_01_FULL_48_25]HJZ04997.1 hypothetical protein [Patescibacteria group bacterium]
MLKSTNDDPQALRLDKIIYAVEACAINLACLLMVLFVNLFFSPPWHRLLITILLILGPAYTLYMGITNFFRLKRIKQLESQFSKD